MPWPTSLGVGQATIARARPSRPTDSPPLDVVPPQSTPVEPARSAIPPLDRAIPFLLLAAVGVLGFLGSGCAKRDEARAESPETRLTSGPGIKIYPRFSADGSTIAFSQEKGPDDPGTSVYVVPTAGGESRRVSEDGVKEYAIDWAPGGKGIYVHSAAGKLIREIALDGSVIDTIPNPDVNYCEAASRDGKEFLAFKARENNYDVGILTRDGKLDFLTETPDWEVYGAFGPKPGDVTFIRYASWGSATGEIFVWSPATRSASPLVLPRARNATPTWSPDGAYMAYCSDVSGNMDLWAYEAATGRTVQLTSTPEEEKSPHWSPDGNLVAFSRQARTSHIFVANPRNGEKEQITEGPDLDLNPLLSRDGTWVAFVRQPRGGSDSTNPSLCVVPADGGEIRTLDVADLNLNTDRRAISWSPDGSQIAFAADDGTGNVDIYRLPVDGGSPVRVTIEPGMDIQPVWSPDGRSIAYVRRGGGENQIWVIPATGGMARQVTKNSGINEGPVWSPDSDHLAYNSITGDMTLELWLTSVKDPKQGRRLREAEPSQWPIHWSTSGDRILVMRRIDDAYSLWAVSAADGSLETKILSEGNQGPLSPPVITAAGEAYFSTIYPGGIRTYADGENVADIYLLRVADMLPERLRGGAGASS
jgi:Tol biopolymer transport system component